MVVDQTANDVKIKVETSKKEQAVLDFISQSKHTKNVKIGLNESIKAILTDKHLLTVVANDSTPKALIQSIIHLSEIHGRTYKCISSKSALGKACGLQVDTIACTIVSNDENNSKDITEKVFKIL